MELEVIRGSFFKFRSLSLFQLWFCALNWPFAFVILVYAVVPGNLFFHRSKTPEIYTFSPAMYLGVLRLKVF